MKVLGPVLTVLLFMNVGAFLLFLKGFFPSKKILQGVNDDYVLGSEQDPMFDRVVVMVIDALRSDFLFSEPDSNFKFVHQLINSNNAVPFTAFSNPPTVTLPRLKGITLGTTPSFLDAILNIADDKDQSQGLLDQDNWLSQYRNSGDQSKVMKFFGDDTWLKLFPNFFNSTDGTNSFFVNDFYEVDHNVTRHLDEELTPEATWDGLILHYLGLDHIGHKTGPRSRFMELKHTEMDGIIERIFNFIEKSSKHKDTLFVVMGDHGMNDIGNHGGSSSGETSAAMLLVSPKFKKLNLNLIAPLPRDTSYEYYQKINQIDLIPTLAMLLDFPIPKNNLGIVINSILNMFDSKMHHDILLKNCKQFLDLYKLNDPGSRYQAKWENLSAVGEDYEFLKMVQDRLIELSANYNYSDIYTALVLLSIGLILVLSFFNYWFASKLSVIVQTFTVLYSIHFHGSSLIEEEHHLWWILSVLFILYFFGSTLKSPYKHLVLLILIRIIKALSNTGQKFNNTYALTTYFVENPSLLWVSIGLTYVLCGLLIYFQGSLRHCFNFLVRAHNYDKAYFKNDMNNSITFVSLSVLVSISFSFKLIQGFIDGYDIPDWLMSFVNWSLVSFNIKEFDKILISELLVGLSNHCLYAVVCLILLRITMRWLRGFKIGIISDLTNLMTLFLLNQTKIELVPIYIVFFLARYCFSGLLIRNERFYNKADDSVILICSFTLLMANLSFFSMGGTNLLATVDLSNAYNGVTSYQIEKVSLLTFVSNFSGPIFWSLSALQLLFETQLVNFDIHKYAIDFSHIKGLKFKFLKLRLLLNLVFYSISCWSLLVSCFNLRFHLFIWTVFLPKLLYFGVWFILVNLLVDGLLSMVILTVS